MSSQLEEIVTDLKDEQRALERVLERMAPAQWDLPSHAPGWLARDQVVHLAFFDEAATRAIEDPEAFQDEVKRSLAEGSRQEERYLAKGRAMTPAEVLAWWRSASSGLIRAALMVDPKARLPWYGPPMSGVSFVTARLMETWSHGLDVVDVVAGHRPDTDRLRHVAFLGVRTRPFSYANRGLPPNVNPVRVVLTSPSGAVWELGEPSDTDIIRGTATDFCRVVTQRRHLTDTKLEFRGAAAAEWMEIAQAFAGPPGPGRQPGEFALEKEPA
jgi:uncharacterized protein (TIGR03084 family)